jgi:hypothetical protein
MGRRLDEQKEELRETVENLMGWWAERPRNPENQAL